MKKSLLNILFWSVVSAAFIGPGTITTAAKSGSLFGMELLWALLFSTIACLILQEAAARLTILSGRNLGESLYFKLNNSFSGKMSLIFIALSIYLGAAAYEMGNLIGAREGISLLFPEKERIIVLVISIIAAIVLFIPSLKIIARIMGVMVMILGISFLIAAIKLAPNIHEIAEGLFRIKIPDNSQGPILVLGLIGTTIVPYNLFLGSGLDIKKQGLSDMRTGLIIAILLGGIFSMAVMVVGSAVVGEFSFENLAIALGDEAGKSGKFLLGIGLFAAGFTSAITAPLAAAITLKSIGGHMNPKKWKPDGKYYRLSWIIILLFGSGFALLNIKPVPAIILAQALNGLILPFISFFLVAIINDMKLTKHKTSWINNILLGSILVVTLIIGFKNLLNALGKINFLNHLDNSLTIIIITILSIIFTSVFMIVIHKRNGQK